MSVFENIAFGLRVRHWPNDKVRERVRELLSLIRLESLERRYPGLDRVSVSLSVGVPKSVCLEQLEWFGTEVMPEFQNVKVAEPAFSN